MSSVVFVVDDDMVLLYYMQGVLSIAGHEVEAFVSPMAILSRLTPIDRGCVVVDLRMPVLSGLDVQRTLVTRGVALPLIFVSGQADVQAAVTAMKEGAIDFLSKPIEPKALLTVVERALLQDAEAAARRAERASALSRWAQLSPREKEVCRLHALGLLNKEVAAALGTAESTVQTQRLNALRKLGVSRTLDLSRLIARVDQQD